MTYNRIFLVKNHFLLALVLFFLALAACEDEPGCVSEDSSEVRIAFYAIDDTSKRNPIKLFVEGVVPVGGSPYSLDTTSQAVAGYSLFLNPAEDRAAFYIIQGEGTVDTLVLSYQREQTLISPECGPTQRYFNVDTIQATFDSIRIVEQELSNLNGTNIEIYTCQDTFYTDDIVINFLEKEADTTLIRRDSLFVQSVRDDRGRVLANENDTIVGTLRVPINPQAGSMTLTFDLLAHDSVPARTQTLTLAYQQASVRLAPQCALQTRYFDLDTVSYTFDSVSIENRELAADVPLNIEIIDILD